MARDRVDSSARVALALVRIVNGALGLIVPGFLIRRIDPTDPPAPAAIYAFRLFGVRTVLMGRDLLVLEGSELRKALDEAPLVHGSDTVTAALVAASGKVSRRSGALLVAISATNTLLAVLARRASRN